MANEESKSCKLSEFEQITNSVNGNIDQCSKTWTGALAMLLRKIVVDNHDFVNVDNLPLEKTTYPQLVELITDTLMSNNPNMSNGDLASLRSTMIKQISNNVVSIKILGGFLSLLDPEFIDFTITLGRKSGTIKSYTVHIGSQATKQKKRYSENYYNQNPQIHANKVEIVNETAISKVRKAEDD